jgi:hypothetical protein
MARDSSEALLVCSGSSSKRIDLLVRTLEYTFRGKLQPNRQLPEQRDFDSAAALDTAEGWNAFLKKWPQSKLLSEATKRRQERLDWDYAKGASQPSAHNTFYRDHVKSKRIRTETGTAHCALGWVAPEHIQDIFNPPPDTPTAFIFINGEQKLTCSYQEAVKLGLAEQVGSDGYRPLLGEKPAVIILDAETGAILTVDVGSPR